MKIAYLLEDTAISATARVTMAHADAHIARGDRARIVTKGAPVNWRSSRAEWIYVDALEEYRADADETVITDPHLLPRVVDDEVFRDRLPREHEPLRVLLAGPSQKEAHAIEDGYGAVAHARWFHQQVELVRVSPWAPSREEPLDAVQEFHVGLATAEMTRLMHSCDVLVAPTRHEEGFALTTAEAMAAGLACVMTAIPAHLAFDETPDFAAFAPENNAVALGEALIRVLEDAVLRRRLRERARTVAEQWRPAEGRGRSAEGR